MSVPTTSYNPNIPQATDLLSNSQLSLLNNFGAIQTLVDVDHVDFANAAGGQHNKVSLVVQSPAPTFASAQVGLYSFLNATTNQNELYVNKTNQATVTQIPATASTLSITSAPSNGAAGFTYLPSGILMKWGSVTGLNGSSNIQVNGIANQPNFQGVFNIQLTIQNTVASDPNASVALISGWSIPANNYFTVYASPRVTTGAGNAGVFWLAIGY